MVQSRVSELMDDMSSIKIDELLRDSVQTELDLVGYVKLSRFFPPGKIKSDMLVHKYGTIFNGWGKNDKKRSQHKISKTSMKIFRPMVTKLKKLFPKHIVRDGYVIKSRPNCKTQRRHRDYERNKELLESDLKPLSMLYSVNVGGKLRVWEKSHLRNKLSAEEVKQVKTIELDAGDAVIFRGDLYHSGAAYKCVHHRVHFYMDVKGVNRIENATYF